MTRIEFLLLADNTPEGMLFDVVCQRARAACGNGGMYIHTTGDTESRALDEHMWVAESREFIPHLLANDTSAEGRTLGTKDDDIVIGHLHEPDGTHYTLLNTGTNVPWFFGRFEQLIEVVRPDERSRNMGRERYRYYKRRGYPLIHRQL